MKKVRMFFVLLIGLFVIVSCQKDNPMPSSTLPKVVKTMDAMVVKTNFDWKTAIQYKFTLTAKSSHAVIFVTPSGGVNRKYFMIANNPFTVTLSIPAYEKTIHLIFNGKDIELPLSGPTLSYSFNY